MKEVTSAKWDVRLTGWQVILKLSGVSQMVF